MQERGIVRVINSAEPSEVVLGVGKRGEGKGLLPGSPSGAKLFGDLSEADGSEGNCEVVMRELLNSLGLQPLHHFLDEINRDLGSLLLGGHAVDSF